MFKVKRELEKIRFKICKRYEQIEEQNISINPEGECKLRNKISLETRRVNTKWRNKICNSRNEISIEGKKNRQQNNSRNFFWQLLLSSILNLITIKSSLNSSLLLSTLRNTRALRQTCVENIKPLVQMYVWYQIRTCVLIFSKYVV